MTEHDQSKKFADKTAATANKAFATVEKSARAVEQSYSVSLENIRAFNLKMIGMARATNRDGQGAIVIDFFFFFF